MIYSDFIRRFLLASVGSTFVFFALWTLIKPEAFAAILGYELKSKNAFSELYAIYVGLFLAQALLCGVAFGYDAATFYDGAYGRCCAFGDSAELANQ